jgi:hypothetical protein
LIYIFLYSLLSAVYIISCGLFLFKNNGNKIKNLLLSGIFGSIVLSFIALFLNFFIPLDKTINTLIFLLILTYGIFCGVKKKFLKQLIFTSTLIAILSTFMLAFDNINRPDASLYHLPYTRIINENKIIFGISNLHFRFGHTSILQYLNAIFYNKIFNDKGILIPAANIFTLIVWYFYNEIKINHTKNRIYTLYLFFTLSYIFYGYNRYSEFGNDTIAHLFFLATCSYFIKEFFYKKTDPDVISNILILCIFTAMLKPTLILVTIIPLYCYYFYIKKEYLFNVKNIFIFLFLALYFIKNIIISGCILYPVEITCFDQLAWFSKNEVFAISPKVQSLDNEAWTKGWPDYRGVEVTQDIFVRKFFWLKTWLSFHGFLIFKKISIFVIYIFIIYLIIKKIDYKNKIITKTNKIKYIEIRGKIKFLLMISFLGTLIWFVRFPVFRYGSSYIVLFVIFSSILLITKNYQSNIKDLNLLKFFNNSLLIIFLFFLTKNSIRIYSNFDFHYFDYPWPKIYSQNKDSKNAPILTDSIFLNDKIVYYVNVTPNEGCGYSPSPCTSLKPNKIIFYEKNNYKFYNLQKY